MEPVRFHYGVDLANKTGTPIWASADGVVSYAAPLSSYGNVVILTHSINGQIYTTVYAHLSAFNVSVGDVVNQGQQIAAMGSTGRSTGDGTCILKFISALGKDKQLVV
ncbi:hypothetical protein LSPH24S_07116 [Lysinibacillus sphaericus]